LSFLNPLFLFGLAAAAIPVIIHLFTRRRPKEVKFPSLEFLTEVNQSEIRRLRIKQWLLLLLRTLAVASLALAISRPALKGTVGIRGGAATTVVVLVDRSGSMSAASPASAGGGALINAARRVVENVLATLGPQDDCLLVPYDHAPEPLTPKPSSDLSRLRAAAQGLDAGAQTTDHHRALEFAARALRESHALNRELFWVSDFQTVGFANAAGNVTVRAPDGPWAEARVYLVPVPPRSRSNVGLTDASLAPSEGNVSLSVASRSFEAHPGDLAVEVLDATSGTAIGRGFLNAPAEGDATTLLPLSRLPAEGGIASLPDDVLPLDNHRYFASGRAGTLRIVIREDGPPSPLRLALQAASPASGLTVESADAGTLASRLADADAVVLDDLERLGSSELQAVLDFHRAGGGVFLVLGMRADAAFWNGTLLGELGVGELGDVDRSGAGGAWRLQSAASGHPVLVGFPARPGEPVSTARFERVRAFRPGRAARVVLEFDRAHPALLEVPHAFVFSAPLGVESSDFPVSGAFLPLMHQIVRVLARGTAGASLEPGDRYTAPATTGSWRIEDSGGREVGSELQSERGATRLVSAPLERPGLYRVFEGGKLRNTFAVNPDTREFDLADESEREIAAAFPAGRAQILHPGADLARRVREARYGRELWLWFVMLALLLLVVETMVARWGMVGRARAVVPAA
jgi:hypothetical protein